MWVIVDSDGEDVEDDPASKNSLKENDLVSFLNQIPFADIFRQVIIFLSLWKVSDTKLQPGWNCCRYCWWTQAVGRISTTWMWRQITTFYAASRLARFWWIYFSKESRITACRRTNSSANVWACWLSTPRAISPITGSCSGLIAWSEARTSGKDSSSDLRFARRETYTQRSIVDSAMLDRLQVEYDEFMVRVVHSLYTTHNRIGWQYLATLPFGMVATQTLWKLYQYLLHTNAG